MPGHASDDYGERLDLMTAEELEDHHADPSNDEVSIIPRRMYMEKLAMLPLAAGDERQRAEFLARKPALGLSRADIEGILARAADARVTASQRRRAFSLLRNQALQALVPCSGAATLDAVCAALLAELDAGAVAPLPAWYAWEPSNFGRGRRMGYFACDARSCWVTEDPERALFSCARCKKAKYCSKVREACRPNSHGVSTIEPTLLPSRRLARRKTGRRGTSSCAASRATPTPPANAWRQCSS